MKATDIFQDLRNISLKEKITKTELLNLLKKYCKIISPYDLMLATARMREEGKYVQANYREKYLKVYVKYFIMRVKEILDDENYLDDIIDKASFDKSFSLLEYQFEKERKYNVEEDKFPLIYIIVALYTTFILEEPIHPVGSEFPGNLKVEKRNGVFYCPVKDKQKDNKNAICNLCLAEQTPEI
ncbi:DUF2115 domain-containing protein [uncultured Methanobrevibacter sp.]|uniref:DUF2115 domain-containing protein n=1 Tax=uncultured Methanobrevibacter sp. TaxID=253161 RepID=UPI0026143EC3|nr:DUF2115 domain-containing protein [uncultured Methanobrevibacter sp.]